VTQVITDLGILEPDPESSELTLTALHPGATVDAAQEATAWELRVADELGAEEEPSSDELEALRSLKTTNEEDEGR
jgi:glutaconate CoA-transferase subunit B